VIFIGKVVSASIDKEILEASGDKRHGQGWKMFTIGPENYGLITDVKKLPSKDWTKTKPKGSLYLFSSLIFSAFNPSSTPYKLSLFKLFLIPPHYWIFLCAKS
jgi:hypothetical protein